MKQEAEAGDEPRLGQPAATKHGSASGFLDPPESRGSWGAASSTKRTSIQDCGPPEGPADDLQSQSFPRKETAFPSN